ncbi:MAG TPA: hypothetical protein VD772_04630, partial [Anseongella sp.]|nr:hypothetical protein [Anseongella sp.]
PRGEWIHFFTGELQQGGRWLETEAGPEEMPVWVRAGAQVPFYPEKVSCTDEMDLRKTRRIRIDASFKGIWDCLPLKADDLQRSAGQKTNNKKV